MRWGISLLILELVSLLINNKQLLDNPGFRHINLTPIHLSDIEQNGVISRSMRLHGADRDLSRLLHTKEEIAQAVSRSVRLLTSGDGGKRTSMSTIPGLSARPGFWWDTGWIEMENTGSLTRFMKSRSYLPLEV
jgi:hypothetical protein